MTILPRPRTASKVQVNYLAFISIVSATVAGLAPAVLAGPQPSAQQESSGKTDNNAAFHQALLKVAADYKRYGRVDDWARRSPILCSAPISTPAYKSTSKDLGTHGQKLYFLYAKNQADYLEINHGDPGPTFDGHVGQAVVKESWIANNDQTAWLSKPEGNELRDKLKHSLFIMLKLDPRTPNTDRGWIYGTVSPEGTVTSAGAVQTCVACHQAAPHGRLFGLRSNDTRIKAQK